MPKRKSTLLTVFGVVAFLVVCGVFGLTYLRNNTTTAYARNIADTIKLDIYSEITPEIETLILGKHSEELADIYLK